MVSSIARGCWYCRVWNVIQYLPKVSTEEEVNTRKLVASAKVICILTQFGPAFRGICALLGVGSSLLKLSCSPFLLLHFTNLASTSTIRRRRTQHHR